MKVAVDADVCIYAVTASPWTPSVRECLSAADELVGSVLLPVETLPKPLRHRSDPEAQAMLTLLASIRLVEVSHPVAALATVLAVDHGLRAVDAVHLATALHLNADLFLTNNIKDYGSIHVAEIEIRFPASR